MVGHRIILLCITPWSNGGILSFVKQIPRQDKRRGLMFSLFILLSPSLSCPLYCSFWKKSLCCNIFGYAWYLLLLGEVQVFWRKSSSYSIYSMFVLSMQRVIAPLLSQHHRVKYISLYQHSAIIFARL